MVKELTCRIWSFPPLTIKPPSLHWLFFPFSIQSYILHPASRTDVLSRNFLQPKQDSLQITKSQTYTSIAFQTSTASVRIRWSTLARSLKPLCLHLGKQVFIQRSVVKLWRSISGLCLPVSCLMPSLKPASVRTVCLALTSRSERPTTDVSSPSTRTGILQLK